MDIRKTKNYEEIGNEFDSDGLKIEIGAGIDVKVNNRIDRTSGGQINEVQTDEVKTNEVQTNEVQTNEVQTNEVQTNEVKTNEVQTNEVQTDEVKTNEGQTNEGQTNELKQINQTPKGKFAEVCAAQVIEFQGQKVIVFNKGLMTHEANREVNEKLHITQTNAFVDKVDIEKLHTIAQECSLNGIDPFSSPQALKEMFDNAVAEGVIEIEEAPDLTKNIIIGDKVYFKNGQVADLDENVITFEVGQIERILEAENPEQMKDMVEQIKHSKHMDGPIQSGPINEGTSIAKESTGLER